MRICSTRPLQILFDGAAFGGRAGRVVRDHAGGFPVAGQHDFRGGRAARRQFGREPDPATVRRHARLDAGAAGGRGEAALNLQRRQPDHPIGGGGVGPVGATRGGPRFVASVPDRRGGPVRNMDTGPDAPAGAWRGLAVDRRRQPLPGVLGTRQAADRLRAGIDA